MKTLAVLNILSNKKKRKTIDKVCLRVYIFTVCIVVYLQGF